MSSIGECREIRPTGTNNLTPHCVALAPRTDGSNKLPGVFLSTYHHSIRRPDPTETIPPEYQPAGKLTLNQKPTVFMGFTCLLSFALFVEFC